MNDTLNNNIINDEEVVASEDVSVETPNEVAAEEAEAVAADISTQATSQQAPARGGFAPRGRGGRGGRDFKGKGGDRRGGPKREPRAKPEFDQKMIDIRRVTRVSAGGRRFSFAVSVVIGDKKGKVGVGTGKGTDTSLAVEKAVRDAKRNLITVPLTKTGSIPHFVSAKYCSARVEMQPAFGKGIVAGSAVRDVIVMAGIKDINAKLRSGTKNKLNNAQAAVKALSLFKKARRTAKSSEAVSTN